MIITINNNGITHRQDQSAPAHGVSTPADRDLSAQEERRLRVCAARWLAPSAGHSAIRIADSGEELLIIKGTPNE